MEPLDMQSPWVLFCGSGTSELPHGIHKLGLEYVTCNTVNDATRILADHSRTICAVICAPDCCEEVEFASLLEVLQAPENRTVFSILFSQGLSADLRLRLNFFAKGARMITADLSAVNCVIEVLAAQEIERQKNGISSLSCAHCGMTGLTETILHSHLPLYHSTEPNIEAEYPLCGDVSKQEKGGFYVHFHNSHGAPEARDPPRPPFGAVVRVLCRNPSTGHFLLVHEPAGLARGAPRFWFPAGFLNIGESFFAAAKRETKEEGGIDIEIVGILSFMLRAAGQPCPRVVLLAQPVNQDCLPKSIPDFESVGAAWSSGDAVAQLGPDDFRMRGFAELIAKVDAGSVTTQSFETDEFRALDILVQRLTAAEGPPSSEDLVEFACCWGQLREVYPADMFEDC